MDFLEAMHQKPERLVLLPGNGDRDAMTREQRERLEAHERLNRQREDAQFERLASQPRGA
jgi:hypothetical protein